MHVIGIHLVFVTHRSAVDRHLLSLATHRHLLDGGGQGATMFVSLLPVGHLRVYYHYSLLKLLSFHSIYLNSWYLWQDNSFLSLVIFSS